jgi:hypothetical protein
MNIHNAEVIKFIQLWMPEIAVGILYLIFGIKIFIRFRLKK